MTEINLLPWRELKREEEKKRLIILLCLTFIVALCVIFLMHTDAMGKVEDQISCNKVLKDEINILDEKIQEIKHLKEVGNNLISRMRIIQGLQSKRTLTVHLFDELVKILPNGVYLTEFKREYEKITLIGYSESNTSVSILMRSIQQNPWIENPVLTEIKKDKDTKSSMNNEFNLSFILRLKAMPAIPL